MASRRGTAAVADAPAANSGPSARSQMRQIRSCEAWVTVSEFGFTASE